MSELWDPIFGATAVVAATDDRAWVKAMCEAEAALARACAKEGLITAGVATQIGVVCTTAAQSDPAELGRLAAASGNPVIPLVARLRASLPEPAASAVHLGATSQDILDTAAMLVTRRALDVVLPSLREAGDAAAALARVHRSTPMAARTLLQQASPTTFGAVAAAWGAGLDRAAAALERVREHGPAAQLSGAGGNLSALHPHGLRILAAFAHELGLTEPEGVWHTERTRIAELAGALGTAAGAGAKVATDIVLLAQTEVGEVSERNGGGSSAMPQKQNPVAAITARAAAAQAPGLVATLLSAMASEHQRGAGPWHAEWQPLRALLRATGGAAARIAESLGGLQVDTAAMARNLRATGGLLLAERVAVALTPRLGRAAAAALVERAARQPGAFREALLADPEAVLGLAELDRLLDPLTYLGHAEDLVDRYLERRAR